MKHTVKILVCHLSLAFCALAAAAADVEVAGRTWTIPDDATLDGTVLTLRVDGKTRRSAVATTTVDLSPFLESGVEWRVRASIRNVAKPDKSWMGLKAMLSYRDAGGTMRYPGPPGRTGDFGWYAIRYRASLTNGVEGAGTITIGLQEATGEVDFDLASFWIGPAKVAWPEGDPDHRCEYTNDGALRANDGGAVRQMTNDGNASLHHAALRGVMLPSRGLHEEDFAKLRDWGVTLVRYQMSRNWDFRDTERDLADYDNWLEVKLAHLEERVIPFARKYGIKVAVDLHMPPGGKSVDMELNLFYEPEYADHFVELWRRIARRFKGNGDVIYGYDLLNEPLQTYNAAAGNDYWSLQKRAAEAIREIDPDVPIIVESRFAASPRGFSDMVALDMKDVIYELHHYSPFAFTHQGVNTSKPWVPEKWPDEEKGWNMDFLRKTLEPVLEFQRCHGARIYVGEFSAIAWAEGADRYLADSIALFEEYGWDWTYHAFDEAKAWNVEMEADKPFEFHPAEDTPRKRALLEGLQKVQTSETALPPLEGLSWRLPSKYATLDGDKLIIDIPADAYPADAVAEANLPLSLFDGASGFSMSVQAEGRALAKPTHSYLGLKFQFHVHQESTGRDWWPNCANEIGDFPVQTLRNDIAFGGMEPDSTVSVTLMLGLQGTSGRVVFDLSTLRGGPSEGLFRRINSDWIVHYPGAAERRKPLRGCMLPGRATTEDDIETLHQWGATLARFSNPFATFSSGTSAESTWANSAPPPGRRGRRTTSATASTSSRNTAGTGATTPSARRPSGTLTKKVPTATI